MSTTKPEPPKKKRDPRALEITLKEKGKSREAMLAEIAYDPVARALSGAGGFIKGTMGEQPITESLEALMVHVSEVSSGNLQSAERTLVAQANTLDAIFNELARRSAVNMGEYINAAERYMRLALKAQSQCRATLETLSAIKNPPVIYAKQANISNGPQQVNNGSPAPARENKTILSNELFEHQHEQRMDARTQSAAIGADKELAALGEIDRAKDG